MGFVDKLDNKAKHLQSRREEVAEVEEMRRTIEAEYKTVEEQIRLIGQYFWNLYEAGKYKPGDADRVFFETIKNSERNIRLNAEQIEDRKITGIQERDSIDRDTVVHVAEKEKLAEEKRQKKAEETEERRQKKEAEAEAKRQKRAEESEEKRQKKAEEAEVRRQRKAAEAEAKKAQKEAEAEAKRLKRAEAEAGEAADAGTSEAPEADDGRDD